MKNYNIKLLNETYDRVVNFLEKNSNLKIYIGGNVDDINSDFTEICISNKNYSYPLMFKASLKNSSEEDNKYSFLLYHKDNDYDNYIGSSIFKFAERCRNYYEKYDCEYNYLSYELYCSEAGKLIKDIGFPDSLEELTIKMDLLGI